jgi:CHAT domain-containing protein
VIAPQVDLLTMGGGDYGALPAGVKACDNHSLRAGGSFCPLPNAEIEANQIAALARARSLSVRGPYAGRASTEAVVKSEMPGSRIAHLATHGATNLVGGELGLYNVALVFSGANDTLAGKRGTATAGEVAEDGLLYGYEASRLPLYGTELVTLSACQTALGDVAATEGFYSLAYAFRLAGADNVLMSLWTVDDTQTARFMEMLYDTWFARRADHPTETAGESLRRALRDTRLVARDRPDFAERHWAAFVLVEN